MPEGIVTEVREDGIVVGAHLNGRKDNELGNLVPLYADENHKR